MVCESRMRLLTAVAFEPEWRPDSGAGPPEAVLNTAI